MLLVDVQVAHVGVSSFLFYIIFNKVFFSSLKCLVICNCVLLTTLKPLPFTHPHTAVEHQPITTRNSVRVGVFPKHFSTLGREPNQQFSDQKSSPQPVHPCRPVKSYIFISACSIILLLQETSHPV